MKKLLFAGIISISFLLFGLVTPQSALASNNTQAAYSCQKEVPVCTTGGLITNRECACCGNCKIADFRLLIVTVAQKILEFTGSITLLFVVYGGFVWMTSGGNAEQVKKGHDILTGAAIGAIIVLGAWLIVNFILTSFTNLSL
jgi:hypothetical protein